VTGATPLERLPGDPEAPHLIDARVIEDATMRAHPVPEGGAPAFRAFLDGAQESQVLAWVGAAPIVHGTVGAVVRERIERRLVTWRRPLVSRRLYAPLAHVPRAALEAAFAPGALADTTRPAADGVVPPPHPTLLLEHAKSAVSRDREALERELAEAWCTTRDEPLMIDGGIGGSSIVAQAPCAVGVVKSHRTLYADAGLDTVIALTRGERSSVIEIAPRDRSRVHSWYLRLRDPSGHDALWGLVRVEVACIDGDVRARADEVSRWVLAESTPLSMPDPRWDKMAYGIRNAEQYLRAIT
jgi:hypothetical protein